MVKHLILVAEDDVEWQAIFRKALEGHGYSVIQADSVETAILELQKHKFSLVTVDLNYRKSQSAKEIEYGPDLLKYITDKHPELPCIVITGSGKDSQETAELVLEFKDVVRKYLEKNSKIHRILPKEIEAILATNNSPDEGEHEKSQSEPKTEVVTEKEIFISYAWGGESERIVNKLDKAFQVKGVTIVRDKRDLGFKGRIKEFMERIGRGKCVIVVISEEYLESENCMFELVQISKNGQFYDRIFPIVLADAKIYKPIDRIKYIKHWEEQIQKLDEAMKSVGSAYLQGIREDIDLYTEIRNTIAELTNILRDMNALTPEIHSEGGFEKLFKTIERKTAK